jgi:hypothetical protein
VHHPLQGSVRQEMLSDKGTPTTRCITRALFRKIRAEHDLYNTTECTGRIQCRERLRGHLKYGARSRIRFLTIRVTVRRTRNITDELVCRACFCRRKCSAIVSLSSPVAAFTAQFWLLYVTTMLAEDHQCGTLQESYPHTSAYYLKAAMNEY